MIKTMHDYREAVQTVCTLLEEQSALAAEVRPEDQDWQEALAGQREKLTSDEFRVLVMGAFSTGKSSFLNALLGEKVLPTGILHTTSLITEIRYGEEKKVVVYPKPGQWEGGDEAFEVSPKDLKLYGTINDAKGINTYQEDENGKKALECPFEKIVVFWPIPMLRNGIVLIDSPGLDDAESRDEMVHGYLPSASAVIYLIPERGQALMDKTELRNLSQMGFRQIIIGLTHFDQVRAQYLEEEEGEAQLEDYIRKCREDNRKFTQLGEEGIFFLASLEGLRAKLEHNDSLLAQSGYRDLETYLETYLVTNRASSQLGSALGKMKTLRLEMQRAAQGIIADSDRDSESLSLRMKAASGRLEAVRGEGDRIVEEFRTLLAPAADYVREETDAFLKDLPDQLSMDGFQPTTQIPKGAEKLIPGKTKKAVTALTGEAAEFLSQQSEAVMSGWWRTVLMPGVFDRIRAAASRMEDRFQTYGRDMEEVARILQESIAAVGVSGTYVSQILENLNQDSWERGLLDPVQRDGKPEKKHKLGAYLGWGLGFFFAPWPLYLSALGLSLLGKAADDILADAKKESIQATRKLYDDPGKRTEVEDSVLQRVNMMLDTFFGEVTEAFRNDIRVMEREVEDKKTALTEDTARRMARKTALEQTLTKLENLDQRAAQVGTRFQ